MSELGRKQRLFAWMVAEFLWWLRQRGYEFTIGEVERGAAQIAWNVAHGLGIRASLHAWRLAIDIHLFINGVYQTDVEAYRPLGEKWESMGGTWGGRFKDKMGRPKPDAPHFSLEYQGIK